MIDIVVTYCTGNLDVFLKLAKSGGYHVYIYNKHSEALNIELHPNVTVINIVNKGVDTHTVMYHISKNYQQLSEITLFTTDSVLTSAKKRRKFDFIINNLSQLQQNSGFLTGHIIKTNIENNFELTRYRGKNLIRAPITPFYQWFNQTIHPLKPTDYVYTCKKSIYAVTRDLIYRRSREFYSQQFDIVSNYSNSGHDSELPHYYERAWVELYTSNPTEMFHDESQYGKIPH